MSTFKTTNVYLVGLIMTFLVLNCAPKMKPQILPQNLDQHYLALIAEAEKNPETLLKKEQEIKELLVSRPDYPLAHEAMGMIHLIREDPDPAISEFKKAIKNIKADELHADAIQMVAHFYLGVAFHMKGLHDLAVYEFKRVLEMISNHEGAHLRLGLVYVAKKDINNAIDEFKKVVKLNPRNEVAHLLLGASYGEKKLYDLAIHEYRQCIKINPKNYVAYNNRGEAYRYKGQYDLAISDFNKALEINPRFAPAYYNRGLAYAQGKGQYDRAISDFNKVLEINPRLVEAYTSRGEVYYDKDQYDVAVADFNKAIELNPEFALAYFSRGRTYYYMGMDNLSIGDFNKTIGLNPRFADAYYWRGLTYYYKDKDDAAIEDFTKAIELNPKFADAYYGRGITYYDKDQYDLAIEDFAKAIELNPKYAQAYYRRGRAYHSKNQYDIAIRDFNKAIELDPEHIGSHLELATIYSKRMEHRKAIDKYALVMKKKPDRLNSHYRIAEEYYHLGLYDEAISQYETARFRYIDKIKNFNKNLDGSKLIESHKFTHHSKMSKINDEQLVEILEQMIIKDNSPVYYEALSPLYYKLRIYNKARKNQEKCVKQIERLNFKVEDKKHFSHYYWSLGWCYWAEKDYENALVYYNKAKDIYSNDKYLQFQIAKLYLEKGDISQSEVAFMELREKFGLNQYLIDNLIRLSNRGKFQDEVEHILKDIFKLKEIIKSDEEYHKGIIKRDYYADTHYKRGLEKEAEGDHQGAETDFAMAIAIYLNTLKTYNVNMDGEDLIKAHKFIHHSKVKDFKDDGLIKKVERLVKNEPSPIYYDALAKLYMNQGNYDKAIDYYHSCFRMIENAPYKITDQKHLSEYYYYCACCYSRCNDIDSAVKMLTKAFGISKELSELALNDPGLNNLRNYLGEAKFRRIVVD